MVINYVSYSAYKKFPPTRILYCLSILTCWILNSHQMKKWYNFKYQITQNAASLPRNLLVAASCCGGISAPGPASLMMWSNENRWSQLTQESNQNVNVLHQSVEISSDTEIKVLLLISVRKSDYIHHCNTVKYAKVKGGCWLFITPLLLLGMGVEEAMSWNAVLYHDSEFIEWLLFFCCYLLSNVSSHRRRAAYDLPCVLKRRETRGKPMWWTVEIYNLPLYTSPTEAGSGTILDSGDPSSVDECSGGSQIKRLGTHCSVFNRVLPFCRGQQMPA